MPEPTGRNDGLLQDYSRGLSKWLASRPDARYVVRQVCREIELQRTTGTRMTADTQKLHQAIAEAFTKLADSQVAADAEIAQALNRGFWTMFETVEPEPPRILNPTRK